MNKKTEEAYIQKCLQEISEEVVKSDLEIKSLAVAKLCVLHIMGYSMNWASFYIVEVMSSPNRSHKRIGYHAAALCFKQDTDVLMLCTNLIRKDLASNHMRDGAMAMHTLAQIVNPALARDLHPDLITMLNHSQPYMRKRAILVMYRIILKYPDALRVAFPRLREKLEEDQTSVVSACVSVICELARKNPAAYLKLVPPLFNLLTGAGHNWMLIKIVKLFVLSFNIGFIDTA